MRELPKSPGRPRVGEYATLIRGGSFNQDHCHLKAVVETGTRCKVLQPSRTFNRKKIWVWVHVLDEFGQEVTIIEVPWWWLRPRSILDDIVEA